VRLADTTAMLQEEKLRLDALLVRQYNLLAVLGGPRGRGGGKGDSGSQDGSMESREGLTLGGWQRARGGAVGWRVRQMRVPGPILVCQCASAAWRLRH
jgi:hypothetical protein